MNKENQEPYFINQAFSLIRKMGVITAKQEWTRKKLPLILFDKAHNHYQNYIHWLNKYNNVIIFTCNPPRIKIRL